MADMFLPQSKARQIIRELNILRPADISIEDIAWTRGALVIENGLRGADARLVYTQGIRPAIIRINATVFPSGRKRFAVAHELGHLELRHNPGAPTECTEEHFLSWYEGQRDQEVEANIFAAELLMPEELFRNELENTLPSMKLIEHLADKFHTTLTATAIRYVDLCEEKCAIIFSRDGKVAWPHRGPEFHHWVPRGHRLSSFSCAAEYFSKGTLPPGIEDVRLDAWVEGASPRKLIKEDSRALGSYNAVLTLLWIP